jgi:hypothetical protein
MNPATFIVKSLAAEEAVDHEIQKFKAPNPTPLLCRSAVRELLLELARRERPFHKWTRVSEDTLITANEHLRVFLIGHIKRLPSKGKTI